MELHERVKLDLLEGIGHDAVRVERARKKWNEIAKMGKEMAMRLRIVANCLDDECPERVTGFLCDRMIIVKDCREENQPACEFLEDQPHAKDVFQIPDGVRAFLVKRQEAGKLLFPYEEILATSIRNYKRNRVRGAEVCKEI